MLDLDPRTVYESPKGHKCLFKPLERTTEWLYFEYLELPLGFTFAPGNLRFMRKANP